MQSRMMKIHQMNRPTMNPPLAAARRNAGTLLIEDSGSEPRGARALLGVDVVDLQHHVLRNLL